MDEKKKPFALDLFCGAGGAGMGLSQAGFEVFGIDINQQPHYPFTFHKFDVTNLYPSMLNAYDLIWAAPPCQAHTQMLNHGLTDRSKHKCYIDFTRNLLKVSGKPYVIENVIGAPLINPIMLCGEMFGLRVIRHRIFECSFPVSQPLHQKHKGHGIRKQNDFGYYYRVYGHETGKAQWGKAMGIGWMKAPELAQAIPPAYSKWIAERFIDSLTPQRKGRKERSHERAKHDS